MLRKLQEEQVAWVLHNFGTRASWQPLLGAVEELGELAHAYLKGVQGIRKGNDETLTKSKKEDAVADIIIYLADFCTAEGIDLELSVQTTWDKVKKRDWKKDPVTGGEV